MYFTTANLAFRFVAMTLMAAQANLFCEKLDIPLDHAIEAEDMKSVFVFPGGWVGGTFEYQNYFFSFREGYLGEFAVMGFMPSFRNGREEFEKRKEALCRLPSHINADEAYSLATNWLSSLDVDLERLENECNLNIEQRTYSSNPKPGKLSQVEILTSPVFTIKWITKELPKGAQYLTPVCSVNVDGNQKRPIGLEVLDTSYFKTEPLLIRDKERTEQDYIKLLKDDPAERDLIRFRKHIQDYFKGKSEKEIEEIEKKEGITRKQVEERLEKSKKNHKENADKYSYLINLLTIPDEEFLKMDDTQKSNLIKRFVAPESMQRISSTKKDTPAKEQKTEEKKKTD